MALTASRTRARRRVAPALAALAILLAFSPVQADAPGAPGVTVVVVVSADSPVKQISRLHLADLYLGRSTRFPDGEGATPIEQKAGSPARVEFLSAYLGRSEAQMKSHWSKLVFTGRGRPPREATNPQAMKQIVAGDPHAIGYLDARLVDSSLRAVRVE